MRIRYFVVFLVLLTLLAGCGKSRPKTINEISAPAPPKEVTDVNEFQNMYKDWTNRLITVSASTNQAYNSWLSGQISKDELVNRTRGLYKETKSLKTEKSYNIVYNLSEADKKQVYYDLITNSYDKALTAMESFLDMLPTLEEQDIKTAYNYRNKIYNDQIDKVKPHLDM